jgi:hypothetical protein
MKLEKFKLVLILIAIFFYFPYLKPTLLIAGYNEALILSKIGKKLRDTYEKNIGIEAKRDNTTIFYNSKTGELLNIYRTILIRKEYFYKKAEYTVLKYFKNDIEIPPREFNYKTRNPIYLPFDKNSEKNYDIRLNKTVSINRIPCYELLIIPKMKTDRHFSGKAYFTVKELNLYYLEGTIAAYPFGLKNLNMQIYFKKFQESAAMSHGMMILDVHIPLFYPNKKIVFIFNSSGEKFIPAKP